MLDIAIIIILIMGFFIGLKRGFILQLIHLAGFVIAYVTARMYYAQLAPRLALWIPYPNFGNMSTLKLLTQSTDTEAAFYRAIAFVLIFFAVKVLLQIVGSMLDFVARLPIIRQVNILAGGALGLIEVYCILFILLYIGALLPVAGIQGPLKSSVMADTIVNHTPVLSEQIKKLWIEYVKA